MPAGRETIGRARRDRAAMAARRLPVPREQTTTDRVPHLVRRCRHRLTALRRVARGSTDLAVIDVAAEGFRVREMGATLSREPLQSPTDAPLRFA